MKRTILLTAILALGPVALRAQLQTASLDQLASKAKEAVDITLDSNTIQLASKFLAGAKGDGQKSGAKSLQDLVSGLKGITVRNFEFAQEGQYSQDALEPIRAQLRGPGWSKIIGDRSDRETSEIYVRSDGNGARVTGFAILAAEPKELSVVYIEGAVDLSDLSRLGGQFGIPQNIIPNVKGKGKGKDKSKGDQ